MSFRIYTDKYTYTYSPKSVEVPEWWWEGRGTVSYEVPTEDEEKKKERSE